MRLILLFPSLVALMCLQSQAQADTSQCRNDLARAMAKTALSTVAYREETVSTSPKGTLRRVIVRLPNGDFHARTWLGPIGVVRAEGEAPESGEQLSIGKSFYSRLGKTWDVSTDQAPPLPVLSLEERTQREAALIASARCKADKAAGTNTAKVYEFTTPASGFVVEKGTAVVNGLTGLLQEITKTQTIEGATTKVGITYTFDAALTLNAPKIVP
jgi:hypothetical protein